MENQIIELQDALDTFYFLVMGALVMWMAAGISMLEAGLVRSKNTAEILTKNIGLFAIACTMYMIYGYDVMYGAVGESIFFLDGISGEGETYSNASDFYFQVVFVATAMSIVSGVVAERMKLFSFFVFAAVFTTIIYPLEGMWTWGQKEVFGMYSLMNPDIEGNLGFLDFSGSGIVHMAGAAAALAGVLVLGARQGKYDDKGNSKPMLGANLPLATLGTFILWMGWFGFNGGSVLAMATKESADAVAMVFLNTNAASAGGVIAALLLAKLWVRKADLTMALNDALAGLVAITAGPDTPTALVATLIGAVGGLIVVFSIIILDRELKIDDPVGAISVHGVVGLWDLLAVPLTNDAATFGGQLAGAATIFVWVFGASLALWFALKAVMGIRVSADEEDAGVDITECGLEAYPEFVTK